MVTPRPIRILAAILPLALLLTLGGCGDVPLDTATYFSDTLSEPPGIGGTDSLKPDFNSTVPDISWKIFSLGYLRKPDQGDPARQRLEILQLRATEATAEVKTVSNGNDRYEEVKFNFYSRLPGRVRESSVSDETGVPTRLTEIDIEIPRIEIPLSRNYSDTVILYKQNSGRAWAGIKVDVGPGPRSLVTGLDGEGWFVVRRIDRQRRIIYAGAFLKMKVDHDNAKLRIPLAIDIALSY